jgi:type II secretion system protein C
MQHPVWIVNLGLLSFVLLSAAFIYISRITLPKRESIEPAYIVPRKELKVAINIQKIYEDDLFGTFTKELPKPQKLDLVIPFPAPPAQQRITVPQVIEPEFLDPLQITLMGIIVVGSNDTKNRAIISEDKTKQEGTYKVGDVIQDSQLIRIFKNKIVLLRLNGQQEVLYLREQDAKMDTAYAPANKWEKVIKKSNDFNYLINPTTFVEQVTNLSQFIEMINTTTAYQKGKSIGLRIGQLNPLSLGTLLGLQKGDIIININNIPTETTEERLAIYKNITNLPLGYTIKVKLLRKNREVTLSYTLEDFIKPEATPSSSDKQQAALMSHRNSYDSRQQHYAFAPTVNKIRKTDHQMILEKGNFSMPIDS